MKWAIGDVVWGMVYFVRTCVVLFGICSFTFAGQKAEVDESEFRAIGLDGRVFYVSPSGEEGGDGSAVRPFGTIQHATSQLLPGDTLLLEGGVYKNTDPTALAFVSCKGEPENWIRIANVPGENPVLKFTSQRGLAMQGVRYVLLEGIEFDGRSYEIDATEAFEYAEAFDDKGERDPKYFGVGVRVEADNDGNIPHHVVVRNCRIHHTSGGGIATARADYLLIEDNEIFETSYYSPWGESAISVWESANRDNRKDIYRVIIRRNVCYRNDNKVKFWIMDMFSDGNGIILDALRKDQDILGDGYGEPYSGRILISDNICYENGGRGINLYESDSMDVIGNKLLRNAQRENIKYEIEVGAVKDCYIAENVIVSRSDKVTIGGYHYEEVTIERNLLSGPLESGLTGTGENHVARLDTH